jgi:hypothetical protein
VNAEAAAIIGQFPEGNDPLCIATEVYIRGASAILSGLAIFVVVPASCEGAFSWGKACQVRRFQATAIEESLKQTIFPTYSKRPFRGSKRRDGEDTCGGF